MATQKNSIQLPVDKIVNHIFTKRRITRLEQRLLMASFLEQDALSERDMNQINRVFDALRSGSIRVV